MSGRSAVHLDRLNESLDAKEATGNEMADGRLFLGKHGKWGRLIETYHLKLRLLADCIAQVKGLTAQTQRPLLNLTSGSFRVSLGRAAGGGGGENFSPIAYALPFLWTAAAELVDPGDAVTLKMEASDAQYFLRGLSAPPTSFSPNPSPSPPPAAARSASARPSPKPPASSSKERFPRRSASATPPDRPKMTSSGCAFPWARSASISTATWKKSPPWPPANGASAPNARNCPRPSPDNSRPPRACRSPKRFSTWCRCSRRPCDLYSLSILGARALLVNHDTTLAIVTDELLSLARQVAVEYNAAVPLGERICAIFQADPRWLNSLGPHRLTRESLTPQEAFDLVPADLWFATLAMLVRMFPAIGPDSTCRDFGDAPRGGMHKIYDPALAEFVRPPGPHALPDRHRLAFQPRNPLRPQEIFHGRPRPKIDPLHWKEHTWVSNKRSQSWRSSSCRCLPAAAAARSPSSSTSPSRSTTPCCQELGSRKLEVDLVGINEKQNDAGPTIP